MLWFFQRGDEYLRIETTQDPAAGPFALTVDQTDGTQYTELFGDQTAFERHLEALEQHLLAEHWIARGSALLSARPQRPN